MNIVVLQGKLSRDPEERSLASGSTLVSYELTTRDEAGLARTVPVAWFDPGRKAPAVGAGDEVTVVGSIARRFFRVASGTSSRTEVVATAVVPCRRRSAVRAAIDATITRLTADGET